METSYVLTGTYTIKRGESVGIVVWHIPPSIYFLRPESTTSPAQHVWFTQPDQILKATAKLTSKGLPKSVILIEGDFPIQFPPKYLSF